MKANLPVKNLFGHIASLAQNQPMNIALLGADKEGKILRTITYRELKYRIEDAAFWLMQNGLKDKDVLAVALPSSPDFLVLSWACWSVGIITVPLDTKRDTIDEHRFKIAASKAKFIITKEGTFTKEAIAQLSKCKLLEIDRLDFRGVDKKTSKILWKNDLSYQALILFTSGTTSHPKGARLSLKNLIVNAFSIEQWFCIAKDDRFMVVLPLHHINSTTFCLSTLLGGGSICLVPGYSNSRFWKELSGTSATFTSIVPSICFDQLSRVKEFQAYRNKLAVNRIQIGSAPVVVSDVKKFMNLFDIPLYQGYGQTETALRVTGVSLSLDKKIFRNLIDSNSIGSSMSWAEVEIMDSKGNILKESEEGELVVKGEAIMEGYIGREQAFRKGYFLTGDIGYYKIINNERFFFLKGRKKEIIIKGGINISPVAVEDKLKKISSDIAEAYVIGVEDRRYGEEIGGVICWKKDVDEDMAMLNLKNKLIGGSELISFYETPQYLVSFDSTDLPMTSTGKVQRSELRNKIKREDFEALNLIHKNSQYTFLYLLPNSSYLTQAFDLYNYCWDPLRLDVDKFRNQIKNGFAIVALDKNNKIQGLVLLIRTNISEKALSLLSYSKLTATDANSIASNNGQSFVCVAICSSNYEPQEISEIKESLSVKDVEKYLFSGKDRVFNFHTKIKGGLNKGAKLVSVLPNA
ncbi:MAG: class I adenylate-forming enzyme family protein, partial [Patescibacteria group bacterium]